MINFSNASFAKGANTVSSFSRGPLKEIAIVGRSNVGKSSAINFITQKAVLARVSNTPGRTQQINYFNIDDSFLLVDLPGYGYAKLSKTSIATLQDLIHDYLHDNPYLVAVLLLIDVRHELKRSDEEMMELLEILGIRTYLVLSKYDKKDVKLPYWQNQIVDLSKQYANIVMTEPLLISLVDRSFLSKLRSNIMAALNIKI